MIFNVHHMCNYSRGTRHEHIYKIIVTLDYHINPCFFHILNAPNLLIGMFLIFFFFNRNVGTLIPLSMDLSFNYTCPISSRVIFPVIYSAKVPINPLKSGLANPSRFPKDGGKIVKMTQSGWADCVLSLCL
jgi:hypothetical protein